MGFREYDITNRYIPVDEFYHIMKERSWKKRGFEVREVSYICNQDFDIEKYEIELEEYMEGLKKDNDSNQYRTADIVVKSL